MLLVHKNNTNAAYVYYEFFKKYCSRTCFYIFLIFNNIFFSAE